MSCTYRFKKIKDKKCVVGEYCFLRKLAMVVLIGFSPPILQGMSILKAALETQAVLTTAFLESHCLP